MKPLHTDSVWFLLNTVFRRFSASFTGIIGRVVGFGGAEEEDDPRVGGLWRNTPR
jgi:hypothetical protein